MCPLFGGSQWLCPLFGGCVLYLEVVFYIWRLCPLFGGSQWLCPLFGGCVLYLEVHNDSVLYFEVHKFNNLPVQSYPKERAPNFRDYYTEVGWFYIIIVTVEPLIKDPPRRGQPFHKECSQCPKYFIPIAITHFQVKDNLSIVDRLSGPFIQKFHCNGYRFPLSYNTVEPPRLGPIVFWPFCPLFRDCPL